MKRLAVITGCLLLPAVAALADGPGPGRPMTAAELAAFRELRAGVQAALPAAPAGYAVAFRYTGDYAEGEVPAALPAGRAFGMVFEALYTRDSTPDAQQSLAGMMDRAKGTPAQQARRAELEAKQEELKRQRGATRDPAEKEKIRAQLKALRDEESALDDQVMADYQQWVASGGAQAAMQADVAAAPAKEFTVRVVVNRFLSVDDRATPWSVPGATLGFAQPQGCHDGGLCCFTLLVGPYAREKKVSGYTGYVLPEQGPGPATRARGIAVGIEGPADKAADMRGFLQRVDLAKLKALLAG